MSFKRITCLAGIVLLQIALCLAEAENHVIKLADYHHIEAEIEECTVTQEELNSEIQFMLSLYAEVDENGIKVCPELTDEFAREKLGYNTVDEYVAHLSEVLYEEKREGAQKAWQEQVLIELIDDSEVELDADMVSETVKDYRSVYEAYCEELSVSWDEFCNTYFAMSAEAFEALLHEQAVEQLSGKTILHAIADDAGITVSEAHFAAEKERFMEDYGLSSESIAQKYPDEALHEIFLEELVWEYLSKI